MRSLSLSKNLDKVFREGLKRKFEFIIPDIKSVIIEKYNEELVDVVTDANSRANPNFYLDEFIDRLDEFEYIEEVGNIVTLIVPDEGNFDFSGRLRVLEMMMQGLSGLHVEMSGEDYLMVFGKRPINEDVLDDDMPLKERVYIVKYNDRIREIEDRFNKKFTVYPFSNTPPIDLLHVADEFVEENMDRWIEEVLEESKGKIVSQLRGDII
jgi:hypothetical protein